MDTVSSATTRAPGGQAGLEDAEDREVEALPAVQQDEPDRTGEGGQGFPRVALHDRDQVGQAGFGEVGPGPGHLGRAELGADHAAGAVVEDGGGQVDGRDAERRAELHHRVRAAGPDQGVEEPAAFGRDRDVQLGVGVGLLAGGQAGQAIGVALAHGGAACVVGVGGLEQAVEQRADGRRGERVRHRPSLDGAGLRDRFLPGVSGTVSVGRANDDVVSTGGRR